MSYPAIEQVKAPHSSHLMPPSASAVRARAGRRTYARCLVLAALIIPLALFGVAKGHFAVSVPDVITAFAGGGNQRVALVVLEWRLPRILAALVCGACLGIAGALFQSLTRNPLGSPDILGFDAGAQTGVLLMLSFFGPGFANMAAGAAFGSLATAIVLGLVSLSRHGGTRMRFIVVGIGVAAMLNAANSWLMLTADLKTAMSAAGWRAGSLVDVDGQVLARTLPMVLSLLALTLWLTPSLRQLELGDELAITLGDRPDRIRFLGFLAGIGFTATVSTIAGPIAFLAIVAPQVARLVTGRQAFGVLAPALIGALLLLTADLAARLGFPKVEMPVGALTAAMGGFYLIWLLWKEARRESGL